MKLQNLLLFVFFIFVIHSCKEKEETTTELNEIKKDEEHKEGVQPFAEHIFSRFTNVRDFTMNTEQNEAYFSLQSPARELSVIMKIEKKNDVWQEPQISSFSGRYTDLEPFLSPDNLKLYFVSNRPISADSTNIKDMDIWYVERETKMAKWSEPKNIGAPINTIADEFYPAVASNKNLYYTTIKKELESADDIFMSKWENNRYSEPKLLGEGVNTKGAEFNAFIAPDESYIIFGGWQRTDGIGAGDLYISRNINGEWATAENLGEKINSKQTDFCPFVNNNILYFTSRRSSVELKEGGFSSAEELFSEINKYDNGTSRIYQIDFNTFLNQ
ncbi:hypothetical protein [uncultured Winogradskyella sp.]|uniref:TolB family protein n=1 Tax=uncultured Winogradskyella sp. TaxID=395353 RepID=UPI002631C1BF|nr:hypothetical protein [uncultured Winogradskyella sp.]